MKLRKHPNCIPADWNVKLPPHIHIHTHANFLFFYLLDQYAFVAITGMFLFYFALIHLRGLSPRRILLFPVLLLFSPSFLLTCSVTSSVADSPSSTLSFPSPHRQPTLPTNIPLGPSSVYIPILQQCDDAEKLSSCNQCLFFIYIHSTYKYLI